MVAGAIFSPLYISGSTVRICKIQTASDSPVKTVVGITNFIDHGVTDVVTGQVKDKMFHRSRMFYGMRCTQSKTHFIENHR